MKISRKHAVEIDGEYFSYEPLYTAAKVSRPNEPAEIGRHNDFCGRFLDDDLSSSQKETLEHLIKSQEEIFEDFYFEKKYYQIYKEDDEYFIKEL